MIRVCLTDHARERCEQMKLRTKFVKLTLREPELIYPRQDGTFFAKRENIVVPFGIVDGKRIAITVLWWTPDFNFTR
jgi:hypothetical protein